MCLQSLANCRKDLYPLLRIALLLDFFFYVFIGFIILFRHGFLETPDALTKPFADFRQFSRTVDYQDNKQDYK